MKFTQIGETSRDCTASYDVTDYKSRTIGEFIQEVLEEQKEEWGSINVGCRFCFIDSFKGRCEYKYGKIISEMPQELLDVE